MRVLWFTNTPSLYAKSKRGYNGGGWIESLEEGIRQRKDITLGVSFFYDSIENESGTSQYFPIVIKRGFGFKLKSLFLTSKLEEEKLNKCYNVIEEFKPDIIHIFGTEEVFGRLIIKTKVPVVIHIQGILGPYINAFFPPNFGLLQLALAMSMKSRLQLIRNYSIFKSNAKREKDILFAAKYLMGRTAWDRSVTSILARNANYFHCNEILRDFFYQATPWKKKFRETFVIVSTISKIPYKGFDLILKTADLLKRFGKVPFRWVVYGLDEYNSWEQLTQIKAVDVNVFYGGVVGAETLVENMSDSDVFVHPSYIDNSPNSVCEAQLLGLPVVSTNVGGISSLIKDGETGILVPANDPYTMSSKIMEVLLSEDLASTLGSMARSQASVRHNKETIAERNVEIYKSIINDHNT